MLAFHSPHACHHLHHTSILTIASILRQSFLSLAMDFAEPEHITLGSLCLLQSLSKTSGTGFHKEAVEVTQSTSGTLLIGVETKSCSSTYKGIQ